MISWERARGLIDSVPGLLVPGMTQERWLFETARSLGKDSVILEVGAFKGRSTVALALGVGSRGKVISIDPFCGKGTDFRHKENFKPEWDRNIKRTRVGGWSTALVGKSELFWDAWNIPIDLLWIDGSHEFRDVLGDFDYFYEWVEPRGWVAFHDITIGPPGPPLVWQLRKHLLEDRGSVHSLAFGRKPK